MYLSIIILVIIHIIVIIIIIGGRVVVVVDVVLWRISPVMESSMFHPHPTVSIFES